MREVKANGATLKRAQANVRQQPGSGAVIHMKMINY